MAKPALGRGLGALLGGANAKTAPASPVPPTSTGSPAEAGQRVEMVPLGRIRPCPFQPRKDFPPETLQELADSIREQGIVQPLIVRRQADQFELIAGERRWRAAQQIGLNEVPVIVRQVDDTSVLELALIENLQREDLNPMEEALGYAQLIEQFHLRQEDVAARVGKSRAVVANALRLLKLPPDLQAHVRNGRLSVGHAKVILGLPPELQPLAAERILKQRLNVRQTEDLIAQMQKAPGTAAGGTKTSSGLARDAHVAALESRLQERFGTKVNLRYRQGKGAVEIRFFNDDDLDRILAITGVSVE